MTRLPSVAVSAMHGVAGWGTANLLCVLRGFALEPAAAVLREFRLDRAIQIGNPGRSGCGRHAERAGPEVRGADDDLDLTRRHQSGQGEQLLRGGVAYRQTAARAILAVDHDVPAQTDAAVRPGHAQVEVVRIVQAQRDVEPAVGIEEGHAIYPLGHLLVSLAKLGAQPT